MSFAHTFGGHVRYDRFCVWWARYHAIMIVIGSCVQAEYDEWIGQLLRIGVVMRARDDSGASDLGESAAAAAASTASA